jgi:hypothetical protein
MSKAWNKGKGRGIAWIRDHVDHQGKDCLPWPMNRSSGYGILGYLGRNHYAHRMMCELACGPAPTAEHQATHSCGNGHNGCCNPRHLEWKTHAENQEDRAQHGTKSVWACRGKLSWAEVNQIRALKGQKTQVEIAELFGVRRATISGIHSGRRRTEVPRAIRFYPDQGKWRVRISENRRTRIIGFFDERDAAVAAYEAAIGRESHT